MTDELDEILNIHTIDAGNRVLKLIDVNEAKQAIQALIADQMAEYQAQLLKDYKEDIATAVREARQQAIEDVKKAGYGYDDGSGFVLKISFAELAQLKEESK